MCLRESNNDDVMGSLNDRFTTLVVAFDMLIIVVSLHSHRDGSSVSARVTWMTSLRDDIRLVFELVWADPD